MRKTALIVMALCLLLIWQTGWAELSPDQEKRLKQLESMEETQKVWELKKTDPENEAEGKELKELFRDMPDQGKVYNEEASSDESIGRYQAIRMDSNAIFIMDTKKGHLWVWVIQKDNTGQSAEFLFYQGRVVPGSKMGELIDRTYKK